MQDLYSEMKHAKRFFGEDEALALLEHIESRLSEKDSNALAYALIDSEVGVAVNQVEFTFSKLIDILEYQEDFSNRFDSKNIYSELVKTIEDRSRNDFWVGIVISDSFRGIVELVYALQKSISEVIAWEYCKVLNRDVFDREGDGCEN